MLMKSFASYRRLYSMYNRISSQELLHFRTIVKVIAVKNVDRADSVLIRLRARSGSRSRARRPFIIGFRGYLAALSELEPRDRGAAVERCCRKGTPPFISAFFYR